MHTWAVLTLVFVSLALCFIFCVFFRFAFSPQVILSYPSGGMLPSFSARHMVTSVAFTRWCHPSSTHQNLAYYSFIDPERMKSWVGLVGWPVADGLPILVATHQLQVERRTGQVCRPETGVLPLCHATNLQCTIVLQSNWPENGMVCCLDGSQTSSRLLYTAAWQVLGRCHLQSSWRRWSEDCNRISTTVWSTCHVHHLDGAMPWWTLWI